MNEPQTRTLCRFVIKSSQAGSVYCVAEADDSGFCAVHRVDATPGKQTRSFYYKTPAVPGKVLPFPTLPSPAGVDDDPAA